MKYTYLVFNSVFIVFLVWLVPHLQAAGDDQFFSLSPTVGVLLNTGEAKEIVYKNSVSDDLLSLLIYPAGPSLGVFINLESRIKDRLFLRGHFETAWLPIPGNLTNDDWISISSFDNPPQIHSDSTAYLMKWISLYGEAGLIFSSKTISLEIFAGFQHRSMIWEGWDALHSEYGGLPVYHPGHVIDYRQDWMIPYFGFGLKYLSSVYWMSTTIRMSPWMYAHGRDVHILRNTTFVDIMDGGSNFSPEFKGSFMLGKGVWLDTILSITLMHGVRGDTYQYLGDSTDYSLYTEMAGAALSVISSYVGIRLE